MLLVVPEVVDDPQLEAAINGSTDDVVRTAILAKPTAEMVMELAML